MLDGHYGNLQMDSLCTIFCVVFLVIKLFVNVNALLNDLRLVVMKLPLINLSSRLFDISVKSSALLSIENNFDKTDFLLENVPGM